MATPDQKYLDDGLFLSAPFTSGQDVVPIVLVDPNTGEAYVPSSIAGSGTLDRIVKWTPDGATLGDSTWESTGNELRPVVTGVSDLGDATHRIRAIYMSSVIDFSTTLQFDSGGSTKVTFDTSGDVGIGIAPAASTRLHVEGAGSTSATSILRLDNSTEELWKFKGDGVISYKTNNFLGELSTSSVFLGRDAGINNDNNAQATLLGSLVGYTPGTTGGFAHLLAGYDTKIDANGLNGVIAFGKDIRVGHNRSIIFNPLGDVGSDTTDSRQLIFTGVNHLFLGGNQVTGLGADTTIQSPDTATGETNTRSPAIIYQSGTSTGNVTGKGHIFKISPAGASGTAQNAQATVFELDELNTRATFPSYRVGIGTSTPNTSSILDLTSTTGALLLPRMTTTERNALTAAEGMLIANTTTNQAEYYNGSGWVAAA